jgi:hypothetical protein
VVGPDEFLFDILSYKNTAKKKAKYKFRILNTKKECETQNHMICEELNLFLLVKYSL